MIYRTEEGHPFTKIVEWQGKLIDSSSDDWKDACEARSFLAIPLENRRRQMELTAKKRSGGDPAREKQVLAHLEAQVTKEWKWRREQKSKTAA